MTFGVYIGFGGLIDGYSALGVVYEVSLEVVMTLVLPSGERVSLRHTSQWAFDRGRRTSYIGMKYRA